MLYLIDSECNTNYFLIAIVTIQAQDIMVRKQHALKCSAIMPWSSMCPSGQKKVVQYQLLKSNVGTGNFPYGLLRTCHTAHAWKK